MVTQTGQAAAQEWVLLSYRIPREPSTPRIAVWRKLRELGAEQIGDGLVALPHDVRTKEHFEWVADRVIEADGEAIVWVATTVGRRDSAAIANGMRDAANDEYRILLDEINASGGIGPRTIARWRREWRRIERRDYFRAPLRDEARIALNDLAAQPLLDDATP